MINRVILLGFCVILSEVTTQTLDDIAPLPNPAVDKDPKSSTTSSTETKWNELMPALQSLKSTCKIKKERLYNIVKIIKFLLSDEIENKTEGKKIMEEIKQKIKENKTESINTDSSCMFPEPKMIDFDSIVEERLKGIKEIIDDRSYMLDKPKENKTKIVKETPVPKNKTADFSKTLSKIAKALAKLKDQNLDVETETPKLVPIFRTKNGCNKNDFNPTLYENPKQLGNLVSGQTVMNPKPSKSMFNIPCQRTSDILDETANFPLPSNIFCDNQDAKALAKLKDQDLDVETETPKLVPIFRTKNGCNKNDFNPTLYENPKQLGNLVSGQTVMNPKPSKSMFNIPCQRASDILDETANFPLPNNIFCDNPTVNLKSMAKNTKLNLENLPFENIVPNSISVVDSDDSIAILFKPKTISLMQVYGNLLKKITITVLVPYYVSKLAF